MSARPLLLDLFSGAGGAAVGYHRAGFDVVGVDIVDQPNYPFRFVRADALDPPFDLTQFDAIHASPPCQRFSAATLKPDLWPDLIEPVRAMLIESDRPYVIENVERAPLLGYLRLCGSMFGLQVQRHRYFEISFAALSPGGCNHKAWRDGRPWTVTGHLHNTEQRHPHSWKPTRADAGALLGADWMTHTEAVEAIPPAYTEWIGSQLLANLGVAA